MRNEPLTQSVWRMTLEGNTQWITAPGQFVNIALEGRYLRRPISVCDYDERTITLIYKVVGDGTAQMSRMAAGTELDLLTGLGNGFSIREEVRRPLLVGGGVGVPPLYHLAKRLLAAGRPVEVILGFNTAAECFYEEEFRALGCTVTVATADGSHGVRGFVTTAIAERRPDFDYFYACGPLPMLRALPTRWSRTGSCPSRSVWVAASGPAWAARARPNTATNASARRARARERRDHMVTDQKTTTMDGLDTSVELCGVRLDNPVVPASGTFGYGNEFREFYDINILGFVLVQGDDARGALRQSHAAHRRVYGGHDQCRGAAEPGH